MLNEKSLVSASLFLQHLKIFLTYSHDFKGEGGIPAKSPIIYIYMYIYIYIERERENVYIYIISTVDSSITCAN